MFAFFKSPEEYLSQRATPAGAPDNIVTGVRQIISQVRNEGDSALKALTKKFDKVELDSMRIPERDIQAAVEGLPDTIRDTLERAIRNVRAFHEKQRPESWLQDDPDGSFYGMQYKAIERVGIYVPGGTASYPSTVIMTVVPAQIAGVRRLVITSPPTQDNRINRYVLGAAGLLGVSELYAVGGAQAIAALAYGTETVPKVDMIVGPGNAYVNEAKRQVFGTVGIDQLAGPTEIVILADVSANPEYLVRDLFAQAEHDAEARAVLITDSEKLAEETRKTASKLLADVPRRETVSDAIATNGAVVLVKNLAEGVRLIDNIAPEHAQISTHDAKKIASQVSNAGAICIGDFTPAVLGDYFAGPNHVLPTAGNARFSSPLNVMDFMKFSSLLHYSKERFFQNANNVSEFAELEGLMNHALAVKSRNE